MFSAFNLSRRRLVSTVTGAAVCVASSAIAGQPKPEKSRLVVALDGKANLYYLPLTIADQLGYFKAEGLDVELQDFPSVLRAQQALYNGSADLGAGPFELLLHMQAKGQLFQSFVLQGRAPQCAFGMSTKSLPASARLADLRSKKIGLPEMGGASHILAGMVLARAGIKPTEVSFIAVGAGLNALNALRSGQIDAISHTEPVMTMLESKNEIKTLADARTVSGAKAVFGGTMPAACLFASDEFLRKMPLASQALANAMARALKWLQTAGPSDIIKTVPEGYLLGDRSLYLAAFEKLRDSICLDGLMPDDGPRVALRAIRGFDASAALADVDLQKSFTNRFALRAKERFSS